MELIIVIAIIAILAAIAIPNFLGIQRKSKIKADIASAKTIYDATSAAIAEGKINPEKLDKDNTATLNPKTPAANTLGAAIESNLQTIPDGKYTPGNFKVTITPSADNVKPSIKVEIVGTGKGASPIEVYPKGQNEYDINSADGAKK
ncbi:TPA: peptidase [Clostridium perfringens]|nr:peptidase [Clostridium perfringens]HBI7032302.1 peptidase [Clostridium perfringens]HBI7046788.1 peptidase [Clostridium perfringens]HBI7051917.1 peptidase [Clostridium perfringens]HBI7342809.1 peptidase [Clostridium perfringens]